MNRGWHQFWNLGSRDKELTGFLKLSAPIPPPSPDHEKVIETEKIEKEQPEKGSPTNKNNNNIQERLQKIRVEFKQTKTPPLRKSTRLNNLYNKNRK